MAVEVISEQQPAVPAQPPPPASPPASPPARMTFEQFLDWLDENTHAEWVSGEVIMHSPVSLPHSRVGRFVLLAIGAFVDDHDRGFVGYEPFLMKLEAVQSSRSPDILYVAAEHLDRLKKTYLDGPADLVVEIISPDSQARDRGEKYYEYERAGVREYWLIDPERRRAEFYVLSGEGTYTLVQPAEGVYRSAVLEGLWIREEWLWQESPPSVTAVLRQWSAP